MKTGWRKVIIFTEALASFTAIVIVCKIVDAGAFISLGGAIGVILGEAIYGNIQEHKSKKEG